MRLGTEPLLRQLFQTSEGKLWLDALKGHCFDCIGQCLCQSTLVIRIRTLSNKDYQSLFLRIPKLISRRLEWHPSDFCIKFVGVPHWVKTQSPAVAGAEAASAPPWNRNHLLVLRQRIRSFSTYCRPPSFPSNAALVPT